MGEAHVSSEAAAATAAAPMPALLRALPVTARPPSTVEGGASPPASARGRKRRPLSMSALSQTPPRSEDVAASLSGGEGDDGAAAAWPKLEQLLINHMRFAHAFKKNDTALIVPFLARDVRMRTMDGSTLEGQSAVLAHLVGQRMTKLSANLHVKGCPSRTGPSQSSFVYEHGMLFKDPLYIEVLDWTTSSTISAIAHVPLPDAKRNKSFQEFVRASPLACKLRRSIGDSRRSVSSEASDDDSSRGSSASVKLDDDHDSEGSEVVSARSAGQPEDEAAVASSKELCGSLRLSCSDKAVAMLQAAKAVESAASPLVTTRPRQRLSSGDSTGSSSAETSAPPSPFDDNAPVFILAELAVITELTPIRKRKNVNPFVVLHCSCTGAVWKSPVLKREHAPRWTSIPLTLPVRSTSDVLEVSLWDQAFLRSTKVASATVVVSELLKGDLAYLVDVELERVEFAEKVAAPEQEAAIRVQLDFRRRLKMDRRSSLFDTHISSGDEDSEELEPKRRVPARQPDAQEAQVVAVGSPAGGSVCERMNLSAAVLVTLIAWLIFYVKVYGAK